MTGEKRPGGTSDPAEVERRFVYHPPTPETREVHEAVRETMLGFAQEINRLVDDDESREMSLAFTALEECSFWLHAHIARNRQ